MFAEVVIKARPKKDVEEKVAETLDQGRTGSRNLAGAKEGL